MSHTGEEAHKCNVCEKPSEEDSCVTSSSNAGIKVEEGDEGEGLPNEENYHSSGKRSVATATTDDLLLLESSDPNHFTTEPLDDMNCNYFASYSPSHQYHESSRTSDDLEGAGGGNEMTTSTIDHDISDEEDDEEEEIESEEEEGGVDENSYAQATTPSGHVDHLHGMGEHEVIQGPPYTKSPNADPGSAPMIINPGRGRGKGNRKSRVIASPNDEEGDGSQGEMRRKFHCSHCGKSFKTKSHLQRHILTHTGEKPYHCSRCGSKFNQSSSLRNHIIAIHTKEYPHYCQHCNKGFLMPALLHKHLATSHRPK